MDESEVRAENEGEIEVTVEAELIDIDGDGTIDVVRESTTIVADVNGDGMADIVEQFTTVACDLDGDGVIEDDEVTTATLVAVREDFVDDAGRVGSEPSSATVSRALDPKITILAVAAALVGILAFRRRRRHRT